jgi:hypothetical protein
MISNVWVFPRDSSPSRKKTPHLGLLHCRGAVSERYDASVVPRDMADVLNTQCASLDIALVRQRIGAPGSHPAGGGAGP